MTELELKNELRLLQVEHDNKKKTLYSKFVDANKKADIGSIVSDSNYNIIVSRINFNLHFSDVPRIYYTGTILTKQLKPYKSGEKYSVADSSPNFRIIKK